MFVDTIRNLKIIYFLKKYGIICVLLNNCVTLKLSQMKQFLISIALVLASFSLTGCNWLELPAEVTKVGCGYVQQDCGLYIVEIDGVKYAPSIVYTDKQHNRTTISPNVGMLVTVCYTKADTPPKFIVGDQSEEFLEKYFAEDLTLTVILFVLFVSSIVTVFRSENKNKRKTAKTY